MISILFFHLHFSEALAKRKTAGEEAEKEAQEIRNQRELEYQAELEKVCSLYKSDI